MDFYSLAEKRYSCRAYRPDPLPPDVLKRIFECVRLAPSACNRQPYRLVVLSTAKYRDALSAVYRQSWFLEAPWVVAIIARPGRAWCHRDGTNLGLVDAAIAFEHFHLAATAEGLGTCWVAAFQREPAVALLKLEPGEEILAFSPVGYPADAQSTKQRMPLEDLVEYRA